MGKPKAVRTRPHSQRAASTSPYHIIPQNQGDVKENEKKSISFFDQFRKNRSARKLTHTQIATQTESGRERPTNLLSAQPPTFQPGRWGRAHVLYAFLFHILFSIACILQHSNLKVYVFLNFLALLTLKQDVFRNEFLTIFDIGRNIENEGYYLRIIRNTYFCFKPLFNIFS